MKRKYTKHKMSFQKKHIKIAGIIGLAMFCVLTILSYISLNNTTRYMALKKDYKELAQRHSHYMNKRYDLMLEVNKMRPVMEFFQRRHPNEFEIASTTEELSRKHGVSFYLVIGIIEKESNFKSNALSRWSNGSPLAYGPMQINFKVWKKELNLDITRMFNVRYNIENGIKILKYYIKRAEGDVLRGLFYYNNGTSKNPPFKQNHRYAKSVAYTNLFN